MSAYPSIRDLQWSLQAIRSGNMNLQNISIYHAHSPSSSSYQETDSSMCINLSKDSNVIPYLCDLLDALGAQKDKCKCPMDLAFHGVEWELKQLQSLHSLLENNLSIKQLEFQRNTFGAGGLSELSEMLGRNNGIRALIFSDCHIESFGATLLASALTRNETLEELQIWEDSIGSKGAEDLSRMIEVSCALKLLIILDKDSITATPLISAVLARNRDMEVHIWSRDKGDRSSKVVEFTPETCTLRVYRVDLSGARRVACALGWNTTVRTLDMTGIRLGSKWAREFRGALEQNRSLKDVKLSRTCLGDKAVVYIAAGLFKNQFLESLQLDGNWFGGVGVEHLLCPLSRFAVLQNQANTTLKSVTFGGGKTKIGRDGVGAILRMLETNRTVVQLCIWEDNSLRSDDFVKMFKSLERNASLRCLSLRSCKGVEGELVLQTIMGTLQVNPWVEEIDLTGTPLHIAGKTDRIYEKLGQNGALVPERDGLLNDLPLTMPTCCRVFFCGQEFAGKTTLCNSISHNFSSIKLPDYMDQIRTLVNPVEQIARTAEIKIKNIQDGEINISIWNFAGQHQNHALHDLMFPGHGSPSFFLIISSLFRKPTNREAKCPEEIEEDLLYWLRFIVSNSRRATPQSMLPQITIVLTHSDKLSQLPEDLHPIVGLIQRLRERFQGFVELYPTVFTVDARSSVSVRKLMHHMRKTTKTILQRVPQVYQLCNDLIKILSDWRSENNKPAMRWNEFCELCQLKVPALRIRSRRDDMEKVEARRRAIANSLHHVGQMIFYEELGFLILDCDWLCREVLSQLAKLNAGKASTTEENGFMSRKELEKILRRRLQNQIPGMGGSMVLDNLDPSDLIRMMLRLELCYEQDPSDPKTLLLIPTILKEDRGNTDKWQFSTTECVYVGRRLECDDSRHMFLTTGFFPRLQVHLYNKIFRSQNLQGATYSLEKNLISIVINGIHVRVELGGKMGHSIDVLACSTKTVNEILRLFRSLIIPTIQSLCPSITLIENAIRPDCVKCLIPPRFRSTQIVSLRQLKPALLSIPADSMYDYQHTWSSVVDGSRLLLQSGFDYARNLLSDEDFREVLQRRYYDLHYLAVELAVPLDKNNIEVAKEQEEEAVESSLSGIAKGVELVLQRLKNIEQQIKELKQEIQGLKYYEHCILVELHRKVDYLVNYNIQLEERKVPHMFYFVQTQNSSRRLVTRIFSGMTALRLHLLCEYRREIHVVDEQVGCELMQVDNRAVKCLIPYMTKFMKLLTFALKIGAHFATGMGEMIPDLGREVAHLIDSSLVVGAAAMAAGAIGATVIGQVGESRARSKSATLSGESSRNLGGQDIQVAQQWLVDFLKGQKITSGKDIAERFGLWRVRYKDDGHIAWICRRHREMRRNEVGEVPI